MFEHPQLHPQPPYAALPTLDSERVLASVTAQALAKQGRTPLSRSVTPLLLAGSAAASTDMTRRPPAMHRARPLPPPPAPDRLGSAVVPCSLEPHMFSARDAFPDTTPAHKRHTPVGDSRFSDSEDGDSDNDVASRFSDIDEDDETRASASSAGTATPAVGDVSTAPDTADVAAVDEGAFASNATPLVAPSPSLV